VKRRAGTSLPLIRVGFLNSFIIDQSYIKNRCLKPSEYNNVLAMFLMLLSVVFNPGGILCYGMIMGRLETIICKIY
jgi:hypothetical protein